MASEELCTKFLEIPSPPQLANQTVVTLYNRIIASKPLIVEKYFKKLITVQKQRIGNIPYLVDQMSEHFDSYAHLFTLEEVIRSNFLHDCPEPLRRHIFRDKNILRAILLADKNILDEMAFFLRLTSIEEDSLNVLYEVLDEIEAGENYFDIYSHWFPENPLKWIRNIQPDQSASIRKLQKQGIDLEEDVSSS